MENTKKIKLKIVGLLVVLLIIVVGVSYAAFTFTKKGETRNIVSTGTLEMRVTSMNTLSLTDAVPTRDIDGQSSDPYTFVINNIGTASSSYQLKIVEDTKEYEKDGCTDNKMPWYKLRYSLTRNDEVTQTGNLGETKGILDEATIENKGEKNSYSLRIWIDQEAGMEVANLHFHPKLTIEAIVAGRGDYETGQ